MIQFQFFYLTGSGIFIVRIILSFINTNQAMADHRTQKQALNKINKAVSKIYSALEADYEMEKIIRCDQQYLLCKMHQNSILKSILVKCLTIDSWISCCAQRQKSAIEDSLFIIHKMQGQIEQSTKRKQRHHQQSQQIDTHLEQYLENIAENIYKMSIWQTSKYKSLEKSQNTSASNNRMISEEKFRAVAIERNQLLQNNAKLTKKISEHEHKIKQIQLKLINLLEQQKSISRRQNIESRVVRKINIGRPNFYSPSKFNRNVDVTGLELENKFLRNQIQKIREAAHTLKKKFQNQKKYLLRQIQKLENQILVETKVPVLSNGNIFQVVDNIQMEIQDIRSERLQNQSILDRVESKLTDLKLIKRKKSLQNFKEKLRKYQKSTNKFDNYQKFKYHALKEQRQLSEKKKYVNPITKGQQKYKNSRTKSDLRQNYEKCQNYLPMINKSSDIMKNTKQNQIQICCNPEVQQTYAQKSLNKKFSQIKEKKINAPFMMKDFFQSQEELKTSGYFIQTINYEQNNQIDMRPKVMELENLYLLK